MARTNAMPPVARIVPCGARRPGPDEPRLYFVSPSNLARIVAEVNPAMMLVPRTLGGDHGAR